MPRSRPRVERPAMGEYGVPSDLDGAWPIKAIGMIERAEEFAQRAIRWSWSP